MMANEVLACLELDEVRFMPNAIPPHKKARHDASDVNAKKWSNMQLSPFSYFSVESYEVEQGGVSYSYKTIDAIV